MREKLEALAGLRPSLREIAPTLPGARILDGNFTVVRHTVGTPRGRDAAAAYLRDLVEDVKATGLVARWIEKSSVKGLSVAPPAGTPGGGGPMPSEALNPGAAGHRPPEATPSAP